MDYPDITKYVYEEKIGLSHARNTGIRLAQGKLIAFADDDVEFDKRWGQEILNTFDDYPDAACIGGKSSPLFLDRKPEWANNDIFVFYGDTGFGETAKYIEFPKYPFGLNMAFRREVFDMVGMFSPELGRYGSSLLSGEEAELFYRISKYKLKTVYSPYVAVRHRIPADRTKTGWILSRFYWQGVSDVVFDQLIERRPRRALLKSAFDDLMTLTGHLIGSFMFSPKKLYWHIKKIKPEGWADIRYKAGRMRQAISEAFSIRKTHLF
jgi:GT2 family glycosyltransferase